MRFFKLPDLGEGLQEAEIVEWLLPVIRLQWISYLFQWKQPKPLLMCLHPKGRIVHCLERSVICCISGTLVEFDEQDTDSGTVVGEIKTADEDNTNTHKPIILLSVPHHKP